jgi:DNA-binding CsgD family transcriptional regulator
MPTHATYRPRTTPDSPTSLTRNSRLIWSRPEIELSDGELDVLLCLARGMSNPQIVCELTLPLETVKTRLVGLYRKLGATGKAHAVALAYERNLIAIDFLHGVSA